MSDAALLDRLLRGTPLELPADAHEAESEAVDALAAYLPRLGTADWEQLRTGRYVYQEGCAMCHGLYGRSDTPIAVWLGAPDMLVARERHSDAALARISERGFDLMPALSGTFDPVELRALVAYIRHLSDGFAIYDEYCAACHGDDGRGINSRELIPPAVAAPPLRGAYPPTELRRMLRREGGVMPHFAALDRQRLEDVIAYLRAVVWRRPESVHAPHAPTTGG
jgi:mono/diheme cytochrome c family protein